LIGFPERLASCVTGSRPRKRRALPLIRVYPADFDRMPQARDAALQRCGLRARVAMGSMPEGFQGRELQRIAFAIYPSRAVNDSPWRRLMVIRTPRPGFQETLLHLVVLNLA
jgi:hypothetical protein